MDAVTWIDRFTKSPGYTCLTQNELHIPGMRLLAHRKIQNALLPLPPHYHENAFEVTFIVHGSMSFSTGGRQYSVNGGQVFISFPNEVHSTNEIPISLNEQFWLQLDVGRHDDLLFLNREASEELVRHLGRLPHQITLPDERLFGTLIKKAFSLASSGNDPYQTAGFISLLLQQLPEQAASMVHTVSPDIERALSYIEEHLCEPLPLELLASESGLSVSHFKQKFRKATGFSPHSYITRCKVERAKQLLETGSNVMETAMQLGFETSSYFSLVFKKYTSVPPSKYKETASVSHCQSSIPSGR